MKDDPEGDHLKRLITQAVEHCTDSDLLDLIYKLLLLESPTL
jgi:hypothetical protein